MILRNIIASLFCIVLFSLNSRGQNDNSASLSQIKKLFVQINNYKGYKIVTIDDAEEFLGHGTDNGGSLKGYYKGDSLKKIIEWVGLSNRVVQNEYYLDKDKLVLVYSTDSHYKFNYSTGEFDYSKFTNVFKGRYYFSNGKLIDAVLSDKELENDKQDDAEEFLASSEKYITLLKAKRK